MPRTVDNSSCDDASCKAGRNTPLLLGGIVLNCWVVLGMAVAESGPFAGDTLGSLIFLGMTALTAAAALPFANRLECRLAKGSLERKPVAYAPLALGTVAAIVFLIGFATESKAVAVAGISLLGISCGYAEVLVFVRFVEFGAKSVAPAVAFVTLASAVTTVPFHLLPIEWSYTLFALAPLILVPLLLYGGHAEQAQHPGRRPEAEAESTDNGRRAGQFARRNSFASKLIVANLLITTTFNLLVSETLISLPWQGWLSVGRLLANILVCAALLVALLKLDSLDVTALYRVVVPVMVLGLLILSVIPTEFTPVAIVCVSMGYSVFDACTWIVLTRVACEDGCPLVRTGSLYAVTSLGGMALATGLLKALNATGTESLGQNTPSILLAVFVLVIGIMLVLPPRRQVSGQLADNGADPAAEEPGTPPVDKTLETLAGRAGLTNREREVLALLAQGRTSAVISREIGIAEGTAHTHVVHVYQKLGVHSQQELLDLVHGSARDDQRE